MDEDEDRFAPHDIDASAPHIPTFFQPADLPDWLRAPLPVAPSPAVRRESTRARQAWASPDGTPVPRETNEFQTAGKTALTRLVPTPPARNARKRRGIFGIGATLPLMACAL